MAHKCSGPRPSSAVPGIIAASGTSLILRQDREGVTRSAHGVGAGDKESAAGDPHARSIVYVCVRPSG